MTEIGTKRVIGLLSPLPSAFTEDAVFTHPGGDAELRCVYEHDGAMYSGGFRFHRVRAYRFRSESHCTVWHIEDALVEIDRSGWIEELLAGPPNQTPGQWKPRHFLIYVDGAGAYEVAAEEVERLPEEPAS